VKQSTADIDLHEYDNPIKRADGTVPFNGYLWPTEAWWPGHEPEFRNRIHGSWHFGIVALIDGRFAVDGTICCIKANSETPYPRAGEPEGRKVVFSTRTEAIRVAAARMILDILRSRHWKGSGFNLDRMDRATMTDVINWTRAQVAAASQASAPKPIALVKPPAPVAARPEAGLPLFEMPNPLDHRPEERMKGSARVGQGVAP
jgi:hypothetical protein